MSQVSEIHEEEINDFATIVANAYPGMDISSEEERKKFTQRLSKLLREDEAVHLHGLYREGVLQGGMLLYNFVMNVFSQKTLVGGVGLVAVDLLHKREKICKDMITSFLKYYKKKGSFLTCLYPFRPDFYKEMGFGIGTKMHQYRLTPLQLPQTARDHVHFVERDDKNALLECYNRFADKTHGMIEKRERELNRFFDNPEYRIVGYKDGDRISGYMVFTFKKGSEESFIVNDIHIKEFIYENRKALLELLTFLHTQKDQIRYIFINTQDDYFHHLFPDPRFNTERLIHPVYHESNVSGVGIMYRIIDTKKVFKFLNHHNFGDQTCKVKFFVRDLFFRENDGEVIVHFKNGFSRLGQEDYDVKIRIDVSDFSSLIMGVVPFDRLYLYGLAEISDPHYINVITALFKFDEKPMCATDF